MIIHHGGDYVNTDHIIMVRVIRSNDEMLYITTAADYGDEATAGWHFATKKERDAAVDRIVKIMNPETGFAINI